MLPGQIMPPGNIGERPPVQVHLGKDRQLHRIRPPPTALNPQNFNCRHRNLRRMRRQ
jgi:hypothetical protein